MKITPEIRDRIIVKMFQDYNIDFVKEYRFHPLRQWRFDYAVKYYKIAIEIEGATWAKGRHTRGGGYAKDCEKYNNACILGWRVLRYPTDVFDKDPHQIIKDVRKCIADN
jgi:very-short-patch-repair endonuclease